MAFISAKIIKRSTEDALFNVEDFIDLGTIYKVDPESITTFKGFNTKHKKFWEREFIQTENGTYFPLELLDLLFN